ncbi:hypothetical protein [Noviherbaspirillum galbum]|uniref:Uncharacterized protein n=1 Tax=Noviherbaspirillum galbum TaxID=2709383 RepID=A0A6B3SH62_9BURK|nr:hypothetical protein [Noviherbaspirillum galbum]NEX60201.1 hypothetical protein [Noviherbaspirillum galbum]
MALAASRVLYYRGLHRQLAEDLAQQCGYETHPAQRVSLFISDEPILFMAWVDGWRKREQEVHPRTEEQLLAELKQLNLDAITGCGQFYELYSQRFSEAVTRWFYHLGEAESRIAVRLLGDFPLEPHRHQRLASPAKVVIAPPEAVLRHPSAAPY